MICKTVHNGLANARENPKCLLNLLVFAPSVSSISFLSKLLLKPLEGPKLPS